MFLKRMEVKGFKSFAYSTTVEFTDGLTVIVGPNGSGKSNINDAFKWVLGEASKKTLRASSASDMIFSGSDNEKPADFAEVTLIFNNENRILDLEFNEVAITRRSYRNEQQNEYYINKTLVRRRDVKDLFLGTGLGNTDLSIISQGSVTKITDAKPLELRELLNEAASVSKYQSQKEEAIRKLEKLTQNLDIFSVKLKELDKQVGPLKKKKELAEKYLSIKEELSEIELPIIKNDLTKNIARREELNLLIEDSSKKKELSEEKLSQLEKKIKDFQERLLKLDNELYSLQSKQNELNSQSIITESDKSGLEEAIKKSVSSLKDVKNIEEEAEKKQNNLNEKIKKLKKEEFDLITKRDQIYQNINKAEYEINKSNQSKAGSLNRGTLSIIENKDIFNEVYGTVSDIVTFDKKFETAINNSIGKKFTNLVVSDEETVKEALSFLKSNRAGTATFIPAKKVQPREIPEQYETAIKKLDGFLGTMSSILKTKPQFKNVIKSIGGHILVFEKIEEAMKAAKILGYKYEIVTLEGDQIFTGFTVRGGSNIQGGKVNQLKEILLQLKSQYQSVKENLYSKQEEIQSIRDSISFAQTELIRSQDRTAYLESNLQKLLDQYKLITGHNFDLATFENSYEFISDEMSLEQVNNKIKNIQIEKQNIQKDIIEFRDQEHELRESWKISISNNTDGTIELNKIVHWISKDLEILNKDYKMTYENLLTLNLTVKDSNIDKTSIREKLRLEISKLGYVDFDAISMYEEVFETYEELKKSVSDLTESRDKLLSTIEIMDNRMRDQFKTIFDEVNIKFKSVFETLFRGGRAQMIFTEPENILETGVEIEAKMPGKSIKSLSLYSGGEKSLISLSLIFAINAVRKLPILMLDEVEAALDEANVDRFAKFAKNLNKTTQIIITSHRPGTMEQADILYGVTMEQKGITKIVSVKLAEAIDLAE